MKKEESKVSSKHNISPTFLLKMFTDILPKLGSIVIDQYKIQELFAAIDKEDDGIVYLQDVVVHLRALNEDIDKNLKVKVFLDELDTNGTMEVDFKRFCVNRKSFSIHPVMLS